MLDVCADVCVGFSTPLIHMFNKNESQTTGSAFAATVAQRGNVLLMGDGLGDVTMADGIPHNTVLKVRACQQPISRRDVRRRMPSHA